tara:strand:- start:417 stop:632 length:216 start_codon:yes stop_codon:yes gene_type:complete
VLAIKRSGQAPDAATDLVSAENLKAFVSRISTLPIAPFLEKSIWLFIVLFRICHRLGFAHFRKLRFISLGL